MAEQAFLTTKALNFIYKIPTEKFSQTHFTVPGRVEYGLRYEADLVVDKQPEYPDIPSSTWTIALVLMDSSGKLSEEVKPKGRPESLKSPGLVLVDWTARMGKMQTGDDAKKDPVRGDCGWHIGPDGFKLGRAAPLAELITGPPLAQGKYHYLKRHPEFYVLVSLTFIVEKTVTCRVLDTLYESGMLADCKLVCDAREFPAHRAVLAAQSPVFAAMFQNEMKEKSSGICTIKDIHPDVLDALLQFAYTREVTKADGKLDSLWTAADKYDMQDLKQECERLMLGSVSDDNAVDYLYFAAKRGLKRLKVEAAKIISREPV